jgi:hypothetical protein
MGGMNGMNGAMGIFGGFGAARTTAVEPMETRGIVEIRRRRPCASATLAGRSTAKSTKTLLQPCEAGTETAQPANVWNIHGL